jgi:site-specific recombinase XerD
LRDRRHQRESAQSPFVFVSERGAPLSAPGFSRLIERAAIAAVTRYTALARQRFKEFFRD